MHRIALLGVLGMILSSGTAFATGDVELDGRCRRGDNCEFPTKEVCFNVICSYVDYDNPEGFRNCKAAAKFTKDVTKDGGEVRDDSDIKNNPEFAVSCENQSLFNNSARRFTDLLGTRIQGETGPFPAILLPRGALHTGPNGTSGDHVANSVLELDTGYKVIRTKGKCHIWTGAP